MQILGAIASSIGLMAPQEFMTSGEILRRHRGPAPKGMKYIVGVYMPAGRTCNVQPAIVRNPKIAAHVQAMHEKWLVAFTAKQAHA